MIPPSDSRKRKANVFAHFLRQSARLVISCCLMPKVMGRLGFWCAGLMARPTKKLTSVAFSNSSRAIRLAPSFWVAQTEASFA